MKNNFHKLSEFEKFIILNKGTEKPFSGEYENFYEDGTYICKQCGLPLYNSNSKFNSECGWPSFDEEIPGAVNKIPDKDQIRTEITCSYCNAHLGHVFNGENFTPKNTRHCVNSTSLFFIPVNQKIKYNRAFFAAGCFWGVQHLFKELFGVVDTRVGYMGGNKKSPTYEEVCFDLTGHAETIEVIYNTELISYKKLAEFFFEIHDFSEINRQGPDIGAQYRTEIFYCSEQQKEMAKKIILSLKNKGLSVATTISKAKNFWIAEEYHQNYYSKTNKTPYCHYKRDIF